MIFFCCIITTMIHIQLYTYTCRNKTNNNDERTHFFRKNIPLTLYSKWLRKVYVGEVSWRLNKDCNILTPSSFVFCSTSFSFCWAAQSGVLRPLSPPLGAGSVYSNLSPTWLTPSNWTSCRTGLYHCLTSICFLWTSHLHLIQPLHSQGYTLISSTGCTCSLIDGWVEGQYVIFLGSLNWVWLTGR